MGQFIGFWGLTKEQILHMSEAGMISVREFGKRQVLMNQDEDQDLIGIMLKGDAFLESMNMEGQRRILDYFQEKETFSRKCFPKMERGVCYVISKCRCQVTFINDRKLSAQYHSNEGAAFGRDPDEGAAAGDDARGCAVPAHAQAEASDLFRIFEPERGRGIF